MLRLWDICVAHCSVKGMKSFEKLEGGSAVTVNSLHGDLGGYRISLHKLSLTKAEP